MVLYVFITHQKNINNCYQRISDMMKNDFVVVQGGCLEDFYDDDTNILSLNCNDGYVGLPEKVMKAYHYILKDSRFDKYTHICKLDDDMELIKRFSEVSHDYFGIVSYNEGNRKWHMGRCGDIWDKIPYIGEYRPWCLGGAGYVVSKESLNKICPNHNYLGHVYEDLYVAIELNKVGINPTPINIKEYLVSPDH
jgi:hypothetical protein